MTLEVNFIYLSKNATLFNTSTWHLWWNINKISISQENYKVNDPYYMSRDNKMDSDGVVKHVVLDSGAFLRNAPIQV